MFITSPPLAICPVRTAFTRSKKHSSVIDNLSASVYTLFVIYAAEDMQHEFPGSQLVLIQLGFDGNIHGFHPLRFVLIKLD